MAFVIFSASESLCGDDIFQSIVCCGNEKYEQDDNK